MREYREENGLPEPAEYAGTVLLALDGAEAVGFAGYRSDRIDFIYAADGALEEAGERLLKAVMSMKINEGRDSLSVHSLDSRGTFDRLCRRMGFTEDGICPCCQREGAVCLRMRF